MKLVFIFLVVVAVHSGVVRAAPDIDAEDVLVPKEALRFILNCQRDRSSGAPDGPVPVYRTDIDTNTGTTSQKLSLLDTDQLRQSLKGSVHSEEVLDLIIGRLNEAVHGAAATAAGNTNHLRHEAIHRDSNSTTADDKACTINNNIDISVPAQEVDSFNDRVQMLIQQNSFLLLEQINTLFTYKLRSLREDFENMVRERTKKINRKLDAVLEALGATSSDKEDGVAPPSSSEATTGTSTEVETSTDAPGVSEEEQPGEEEEETTEEPSKDSSEDEENGTRNAASRPVASPRPVRPLRNRYQPTRTAPSRSSPNRLAPSRPFTVRPERLDRPTSERPERPDRTTSERPERPDRTTSERPERPDRPTIPERYPGAPMGNRARQSQLQKRRQSFWRNRRVEKVDSNEAISTE